MFSLLKKLTLLPFFAAAVQTAAGQEDKNDPQRLTIHAAASYTHLAGPAIQLQRPYMAGVEVRRGFDAKNVFSAAASIDLPFAGQAGYEREGMGSSYVHANDAGKLLGKTTLAASVQLRFIDDTDNTGGLQIDAMQHFLLTKKEGETAAIHGVPAFGFGFYYKIGRVQLNLRGGEQFRGARQANSYNGDGTPARGISPIYGEARLTLRLN